MNRRHLVPFDTPKDPTAWQLYQAENPGVPKQKLLVRYVLLNFGIMFVILGGIYWIQHLGTLLWLLLFLGAIVCVRRFK